MLWLHGSDGNNSASDQDGRTSIFLVLDLRLGHVNMSDNDTWIAPLLLEDGEHTTRASGVWVFVTKGHIGIWHELSRQNINKHQTPVLVTAKSESIKTLPEEKDCPHVHKFKCLAKITRLLLSF